MFECFECGVVVDGYPSIDNLCPLCAAEATTIDQNIPNWPEVHDEAS